MSWLWFLILVHALPVTRSVFCIFGKASLSHHNCMYGHLCPLLLLLVLGGHANLNLHLGLVYINLNEVLHNSRAACVVVDQIITSA